MRFTLDFISKIGQVYYKIFLYYKEGQGLQIGAIATN